MRSPAFDTNVTKPNLGLLAHHAAKPIHWDQVVVKENTAFIAGPSKENRQVMLERPELPDGFQGIVFKGNVWGRAAGCMTVFWLVGGEVTGWCFQNLSHRPSVSSQSGVSCLWSACTHHPPPGWGRGSWRSPQRYASDYYAYPLRRN